MRDRIAHWKRAYQIDDNLIRQWHNVDPRTL